MFCCCGWHTFSGTLHFSGLQQAPQLTFHSPRLFNLHQLLRRPWIQLDSQLLDRFLYLAHTPWLVQGILAAEKLARLDCASIPISSPPPKPFFESSREGNYSLFFSQFLDGKGTLDIFISGRMSSIAFRVFFAVAAIVAFSNAFQQKHTVVLEGVSVPFS